MPQGLGEADKGRDAVTDYPPGTTVYNCPLPSCEWTFTQSPPDPFSPAGAIPVITGESLDEAMARASMAILREWYGESEQALEAHLGTHTLVEWVAEISRLQEIIAKLPIAAVTNKPAAEEDPFLRAYERYAYGEPGIRL